MGFSLPKHEFESRHRNKEKGCFPKRIQLMEQHVCVVQGLEHFAVNKKVAGSNPAANVFKN